MQIDGDFDTQNFGDFRFADQPQILSDVDARTQDLYQLVMSKPSGGGGIQFSGDWGGPNGFEWQSNFKVHAEDESGNRINADVHANSEGKGGYNLGYSKEAPSQQDASKK